MPGSFPACRIIGVSLDDLDADGFRAIAREALDQFSSRKVNDDDWAAFSDILDYVPLAAGRGRAEGGRGAGGAGVRCARAAACTI